MISFIHNIFISKEPQHVFLKIILFLAIIYIYLYLYKLTSKPRYVENFSQKEQFVLKKGDKLFDDFYAEIYDGLHNSEARNDLELIKLAKHTNLNEDTSVVLDIGSGSGLFSLSARRLGAKVYSFDYDPKSVMCTKDLRKKHYPDNDNWKIEEGSVLDKKYINSLGTFDLVYSCMMKNSPGIN